MGPLGPLGAAPAIEEPPAPPQKESQAQRNARPVSVKSGRSSVRGLMDSVNLEDDDAEAGNDRPRIPPPVQPHSREAYQRTTPSSVTVEQASKPTFSIAVGDPTKVGDLTGSHTVYQVRTKVSCP